MYYILRYSSFSNLDTKSFRKINFKNFPNTKLFGKRFPNGLVFGKRFPNSLVFGKFLKLIFLNSNLNLPPFIFKNYKIDMDAIWWPFLTINWNLNLEKIWKKKKKKVDLPGIELTAGEEFRSAARRFTIVPRGLHIRS